MKLTALLLAASLASLAATPEVDKAKALGSPTAPVTIEVFASFDCPHCRVLHEQTIPLLMKDFVVPGKLYLVYREFPLSGQYHPYARDAANYAVAAGRIGKYSQVSEALFQQQAAWATNGNVWAAVASVLTPAEQKKVQALAKDPGVTAEVEKEYQEGVSAGVNQTPTLILTHGMQRYPIPSQEMEYSFLRSLISGMTK